MTARAGDQGAADAADAAAGGYLRASHADRERVIDVLKAAFVQGRLTKDELDMRVGETFAARTHAELATLTADLPAGLIGAQPLRKPAGQQAPHPMNKVVNSCACAALAVIVLGGALLSGNFGLFFVLVGVVLGVLFVAGGRMVCTSQKNRSGRGFPGSAKTRWHA